MKLVNTSEVYKCERASMNETNDCVVRALACAYNVTYRQAHVYAKAFLDRKNRDGAYMDRCFSGKDKISRNTVALAFHRVVDSRFFSHHKITDCRKDAGVTSRGLYIKKFVEKYNTGTYVITSSGHCFTVKDGVVYGNKNDCRVYVQVAYKLCRVGY